MDPAFAVPFRGIAFCHVPADEPIRLDKLVSADDDDRWNRAGEPTVYLATDPAIAIAELARHLQLHPADDPIRRRLLGLTLEIDGLVDVREPGVRAALGAPADVHAFADREVARSLGARARRDGAAGLLVPSMAFLDQPDRANVVLFMECLGDDLAALVRAQHEGGVVEIRPAAMRG